MRAKEIIDQKEIDNYEISVKKMMELSKVNNNDVVNFISYVNDDGDFIVKTRFPIPSCRCVKVDFEENDAGDKILYFYYRIYFKGSFEKDFEDFLVKGKSENYSFYGPIYDLVIFKEKPERKPDYFQVSFNSISEFYEKLTIQRFCDLKFRLDWLAKNKFDIFANISKYKDMEEQKKNFLSEIKGNKKEKTIYYRSVDQTLTPGEADIAYKHIIHDIKEFRKKLFYPKFLNYKELILSISQNKIKIVSYRVNEDGEYIFYYYK